MDGQHLDRLFDAMGDGRRRQICAHVDQIEGGPVRLDELAARLASSEEVDGTARVSEPSTPGAVAVQLHHVHLPKLEEGAIVEYDPERRAVAAGPAFPEALKLVRLAERADERRRDLNGTRP